MVSVFDDVITDVTLEFPRPEHRVHEARRLESYAEWLLALSVAQLIVRGWDETTISERMRITVDEVHQLAVTHGLYLSDGHEDAYTLGRLISIYWQVIETIPDNAAAHYQWRQQYLRVLHGHARVTEWIRLGTGWLRQAELAACPPMRRIRSIEELAQATRLHHLTLPHIAAVCEAILAGATA